MAGDEHCDDEPADSTRPVAADELPSGGGGVNVPLVVGVAAAAGAAVAAGVEITRRRFFAASLAAGAAIALPSVRVASAQGAGPARPNIVWFRSEDNGAEFIGAYGNPLANTPNIDRLAAEGVLFRRFFTTSPVCAPTKLAWATGMYEAGMGPGHHIRRSARAAPGVPWWWAIEGACWFRPEGPGSAVEDRLEHPVVHVSHDDAVAFATWTGKRLPTESGSGEAAATSATTPTATATGRRHGTTATSPTRRRTSAFDVPPISSRG